MASLTSPLACYVFRRELFNNVASPPEGILVVHQRVQLFDVSWRLWYRLPWGIHLNTLGTVEYREDFVAGGRFVVC
jgi:hypothetical protein